ncbi:helix-turn-helix domain-containing protein (plasmid) [Paenibacillus sp. S-38]|uniref:helix-turn-helix domain-containing protein n=1 Tax=Paenibacillus sp. S-38 TaxID=3416710 RepID=UPI003CEB0F73
MNTEQFEVRFNAREADYLYNHGINRGHTLSYSKVNRCYFLSAEAKQLYHNLCSYAWGNKRDCSPCQTTLRTELGWSKYTLDTYLNELRNAGLVWSTTQGVKKPLVYNLADLSTVPAIVHSEIVHEIRKDLIGGSNEEFYRALKAYKDSELYKRFLAFHEDPWQSDDSVVHFIAEIRNWFEQIMKGITEAPDRPSKEDPPHIVQIAQEAPETATVQRRKPTGPSSTADVTAASDPEGKRGKGSKKAHDPEDADTWTSHHFYVYFAEMYELRYKSAYLTTEKDRALFGRLLRGRNNEKRTVRQYLDSFMELDFFQTKTLAIFCSTHSQSVLDAYFHTGKLPVFGGKKDPGSNVGIKRDYDEDEDDFLFANQRRNSE